MDIPFVLEQVYDAPIRKVWSALTDENIMRDWYFPQLRTFKPVVGFEFVFSNDGSPYQKEWLVTKVEDGLLLALYSPIQALKVFPLIHILQGTDLKTDGNRYSAAI